MFLRWAVDRTPGQGAHSMPSLLQVYHMVSLIEESCGWASSIGCGVRGSLPRILRSSCRLGGMGLGGLGMLGDLLLSWVNYSMVGGVNHIFEKGYFYRKFLKRPAQQIFLPGPKFSRMATVFRPPVPYRRCPLMGSVQARLPIPYPLNGLIPDSIHPQNECGIWPSILGQTPPPVLPALRGISRMRSRPRT